MIVLACVSVLLLAWAVLSTRAHRAAAHIAHVANEKLRQLERERDKLRSQLQEAETVVQELSHDLTSPLVSISGFARSALLAQSAGQGDKIATYLERVEANADGMTSLVNRLLSTARIGRELPMQREVMLEDVVETLRNRLSQQLAKQDARIFCSNNVCVETDPDMLARAMQNIVENALQHGTRKPGQTIRVSADVGPNGTRIGISDEGPGISDAMCDRLFELFQRGSRDGRGLGLAIVAKLADRLGATVDFETQTGVGTTFWFQLPAKRPVLVNAS